MTSVITITFKSYRDIDVSIDNLEFINPRSLEISDILQEKVYNRMKGERITTLKEASAGKAEALATEKAEAAAQISREEEELAKFKAQAVTNAATAYEKATKAGKKKLEEDAKEDAEKARGRQFLQDIGVVAERKSA